jgi:bifunctional DNase/RNase
MTCAVALEVRHVYLAPQPSVLADAIVFERDGQETPRGYAVALMGEVVTSLGGRLAAVHLARSEDADQLIAVLRLQLSPEQTVDFPVAPGLALALAVRLHVPLLGDTRLFDPDGVPTPRRYEPIKDFIRSLDMSGLGE